MTMRSVVCPFCSPSRIMMASMSFNLKLTLSVACILAISGCSDGKNARNEAPIDGHGDSMDLVIQKNFIGKIDAPLIVAKSIGDLYNTLGRWPLLSEIATGSLPPGLVILQIIVIDESSRRVLFRGLADQSEISILMTTVSK